MKLDGDYVFDAAVQDVWDALFDPQVLAAVLPGCEKLDLVDGAYVGDIKVKVGPIQGKFTGKVDLLDKNEPNSYRMKIDGRGPQGFVNATANIALSAVDGEKTKIAYTSEANIGGKIASVGSRLVETSAKAIVKQSLEGLNENIKLRVAAYREHASKTAALSAAKPAEPDLATPTAESATPPPTASTASPRADAAPTAEAATASPSTAATTPIDNGAPPDPPAAPPTRESQRNATGERVTDEGVSDATRSTDAGVTTAGDTTGAESKPVVAYKKADVGKLGAAVAKEVGKTMLPYLVVGVLVIAAILLLVLR